MRVYNQRLRTSHLLGTVLQTYGESLSCLIVITEYGGAEVSEDQKQAYDCVKYHWGMRGKALAEHWKSHVTVPEGHYHPQPQSLLMYMRLSWWSCPCLYVGLTLSK